MRSRRRWPTTRRNTGRRQSRRRRPRPRRSRRPTEARECTLRARQKRPTTKTMAITLTESAAKHVAKSLDKRGKGVGLRLGVRTSGCSGLAYKLEYADDIRPEDLAFECHGVK